MGWRTRKMEKQKIVEIKEKIKRNIFVRIILTPFMKIIYKRKYNVYLSSDDVTFIKTLKGYKNNKRCFIVCNGPSLNPKDLDLIKDEFSFAFNRIYYIFNQTEWRPSCYVSVDKDVIEMNANEIENIDVPLKLIDSYAANFLNKKNNIHFIHSKDGFIVKPFSDKNINYSFDLSEGYCDGGTVTYVAIQIAMYMGFKEIYLMGADHNYNVFRKSNGKTYKDDTVTNYFRGLNSTGITSVDIDRTTAAYKKAKEECGKKNVVIYNATRGGKLEVFERIELNTLFD